MKGHAPLVCLGLGAGIGLALACGQGGAFACTSDAQCVQGSETGLCEDTGYCSFGDPDCPSGRRYGALAGGGLANTCVGETSTDVGPGTIDGTGPDPPSTSAPTDPSTLDPPSSSAPEDSGPDTDNSTGDPPLPNCGDGNLDPGEGCDDGDDEVGDGCNPDCSAGGTVLCSDIGEVDLPLDSYAIDLAWLGDDFVITGWEQTENEADNVALRRYDADCGVQWSVSHDELGWFERGHGIAVDDDGSTLWVAGLQAPAMGVNSRWVGRFDADGGFLGSEVLGPGAGDAVEPAPGGGAVVGGHAGDSFTTAVIWAGYFDATGTFVGEALGQSGEADRARSIVVADPVTVFAAGNRGTSIQNLADIVVDGLTADGFAQLLRVPPKAGISDAQAIAIGSGDDLFVGGYVQIAADVVPPTSPRDAYVARVTQAGEVVWADVHGSALVEFSDEIEALAIAPNDDVVVAGFVNAGEMVASDLWIRRYTADGDVRWDVTIDIGVADILRAVAFGPAGELVVAGEVQGDDGYMNLWVARVAP